MQEITKDMVLNYLLHKDRIKYLDVVEEIKESFETFEDFNGVLEGYEPEFGIELTYQTTVKAINSMEACRKARAEVIKDPIISLNVTHCERL
jgi:hypothetical protein